MNCDKFRERIYLYAELTTEEKRVLEAHLPGCAECTELLCEVQSVSETIKSASSLTNAPRNSALLTHKIMAAVEAQGDIRNNWIPFEQFLNRSFFRYALAALSVIILLEFISEQKRPAVTDIHPPQPVASLPRVLNTSTFLQTIQTTRQWNDTEARTSILRYLKTKKTYEQR